MQMRVNTINHKDCTGCALCQKICPVNAIEMKLDDEGFIYADIHDSICIHCGKCSAVCKKIKGSLRYPTNCYAAAGKNDLKKMKSSSGGLFALFAENILEQGGIVCACRLSNTMIAEHICISDLEQLNELLGSKYVQSNIGDMYDEIKEHIKNSKTVLFCGTPCQTAAMREYIGNDSKLITVELICHGVSSNKMFIDYIDYITDKKNIQKVLKYIFRDKKQGWSYNGKLYYQNKNGKIKSMKLPHRLSSYMSYFLNGDTYRECCYTCAYAGPKRGADLTIGDFWGVIKGCKKITEKVDIAKGISCCLVNSEKGEKLFKSTKDLIYVDADYTNIRMHNEPLNAPSKPASERDQIMLLYKEGGWLAVQKHFDRSHNMKKIIFRIYNLLPVRIQQSLRNIRDK